MPPLEVSRGADDWASQQACHQARFGRRMDIRITSSSYATVKPFVLDLPQFNVRKSQIRIASDNRIAPMKEAAMPIHDWTRRAAYPADFKLLLKPPTA
jgi:hypothetical protein